MANIDWVFPVYRYIQTPAFTRARGLLALPCLRVVGVPLWTCLLVDYGNGVTWVLRSWLRAWWAGHLPGCWNEPVVGVAIESRSSTFLPSQWGLHVWTGRMGRVQGDLCVVICRLWETSRHLLLSAVTNCAGECPSPSLLACLWPCSGQTSHRRLGMALSYSVVILISFSILK